LFGEQKKNKEIARFIQGILFLRKLILTYSFFFLISYASGQTIKEFKEIWVKESREYLLNNQNPLPYLQSGFHHFSRLQDETFAEVLKSNWDRFPVIPSTRVSKTRKFESPPQFIFDETNYHNPQFLPCYSSDQKEEESQEFSANLPRIRKPEYTTSNPQKLSIKFYGNTIPITYDRLLNLPVNQQLSNELVSDFWNKFMIGNSQHLISQLMICKDRLGLNEWGYFLLVKYCSNALYPKDDSGSTLLTWSLMIRSGYDVKIGYNQLGSSVLYRTASKIFGVPKVNINQSEYYIDQPISTFPITTYTPVHSGATGAIHLNFNQSLNFQGEVLTKKFQFLWDKKMYEFNLKYNPEVIQFLEEYPQTDPFICFNAPFTSLSKESLLKQMKPVLAGMKREESAAFLQQFVQKSFSYCPFNDLYGYDRFMFPEELLFKDQSNDKGKSLLYAWMITNLLNQKAALVEYPGFYSVAITLGQVLDGDNYLVNGKSYTIADPTFNNAPLGLVMKDFYPLKPLVSLLKSTSEETIDQEKIWKLALAFGAQRSGSGKDYLKDESGNSYITGFLNERTVNQSGPVPIPFIAKFNENNSLAWMLKFNADSRAFGLELKQLDKNEFYLAGSFRGNLECNGISLQTSSSDPDLFFAQFNRNGEIEWMSKSGLDDLEEDTKLFYIVKVSRSGDILSVTLANEDERTGVTGFRQSSHDGLCYVASRYQTTGLEKETGAAIQKANILFRQNLKKMNQLGLEQSIAYLSSVFNSVLSPGNQLTATELEALNQKMIGPNANSMTNLKETLANLKTIRNKDGIIEIKTINSVPVKISSFRILGNSRLKIIPLDNNDLKIKVIDGIEFDNGILKEKINSLILEISSGNVLIDLGKDHLIISRNLNYELSISRYMNQPRLLELQSKKIILL
jgi:hypothetical protein